MYDLMSIFTMRMVAFLMHAQSCFMLKSGDIVFNIKNKKTFFYNSQHMEGTVGSVYTHTEWGRVWVHFIHENSTLKAQIYMV